MGEKNAEMAAFGEVVAKVVGVELGNERLGGLAGAGGFGGPGGFVFRELVKGGDPGFQILLDVDRLRHVVFVEVGLVAGDGPDGENVAGAGLGFGEASGIGGDDGEAAEHGLHGDEAEAFVPEGGHEEKAGLSQHVLNVRDGFEDGDVGQGGEQRAVGGGGAPAGEGGEFQMGQATRKAREDGDPLDDAGIDHQDVAVREAAKVLPRGSAVDGRVDDDGLDAEVLLDVTGHVVADDDDAAGLLDERRGGHVREPALRAEGQELGRVRDKNQAAGGDAEGFA